MDRWAILLTTLTTLTAHAAAPAVETPAQRGKRNLLTKSYNPPTMAATAVENAWKMWGLKEKPADHPEQFRRRYGLHPAPYPNDDLPMGLRFDRRVIGLVNSKGLTTDCLLCHGGSIFGKSYVASTEDLCQ
jgi:hypothetical protein